MSVWLWVLVGLLCWLLLGAVTTWVVGAVIHRADEDARSDRDRLAAEVAILKAERGARSRPHHVLPHER